jgi:hypothetical protein
MIDMDLGLADKAGTGPARALRLEIGTRQPDAIEFSREDLGAGIACQFEVMKEILFESGSLHGQSG